MIFCRCENVASLLLGNVAVARGNLFVVLLQIRSRVAKKNMFANLQRYSLIILSSKNSRFLTQIENFVLSFRNEYLIIVILQL